MKQVFILILIVINFSPVFAFEQIPITLSGTMNEVHFDGKWSFSTEWKQSSLNEYNYDDRTVIILRSAHQDDFVYVLIDAITDYSIDKGSDGAIICFDTNNDKTNTPNEDDYCFKAVLGTDTGITYRGNPVIQNFTEILNPDGFVGLSTVSDNNDRYSAVPHPAYEFKIPTGTIGRESIYGFYFAVYDNSSKKYYGYPQNITINAMLVPPDLWGEIYSPDKSLPEFSLPMLLLLPALGLVLYLTKNKLGYK